MQTRKLILQRSVETRAGHMIRKLCKLVLETSKSNAKTQNAAHRVARV
jgi:hypothetical protein